MNLRHLQYFIAVAEELHFGRAAARLHIAQPPLSQMIRRLESELKVTLFRRNRRTVELTAAGSAFLVHARLAVAELERGREAAARAERGQVGQLVLGMVPSGDTKLFTEVLRRFGERFPEVRLVLQSLSTTAQVEAIQEGHLDVGFLRMPVRAPWLAIRAISRETLVVALPSCHPLARKKTVRLSDLSDEPNIMFPRRLAPDYYDSIVSLFRQSGQRLHIAQEAEHVQMHLSSDRRGLWTVALAFLYAGLPASGRRLPANCRPCTGCRDSDRLPPRRPLGSAAVLAGGGRGDCAPAPVITGRCASRAGLRPKAGEGRQHTASRRRPLKLGHRLELRVVLPVDQFLAGGKGLELLQPHLTDGNHSDI